MEDLGAFLDDLVSPTMLRLLLYNLRNHGRPVHGRRWTVNEKISALSIYKRSPRALVFLSKLIELPSPTTLLRLLAKVPMEAGILLKVISLLTTIASEMSIKHRVVVISFDGISLKKRRPLLMKIHQLRSADSKNPPTAKCLIQKPTNCSVNR